MIDLIQSFIISNQQFSIHLSSNPKPNFQFIITLITLMYVVLKSFIDSSEEYLVLFGLYKVVNPGRPLIMGILYANVHIS